MFFIFGLESVFFLNADDSVVHVAKQVSVMTYLIEIKAKLEAERLNFVSIQRHFQALFHVLEQRDGAVELRFDESTHREHAAADRLHLGVELFVCMFIHREFPP